MVATPQEVLEQWIAAFRNRDLDALGQLYAEDAIYHQTPASPLSGCDAIIAELAQFFAMFPDETTEVVNLFEVDDWAIWEWLGGNPHDPNQTPVYGCGFFQVRGGKIVLQRGYWDMQTFMRAHPELAIS